MELVLQRPVECDYHRPNVAMDVPAQIETSLRCSEVPSVIKRPYLLANERHYRPTRLSSERCR
jgi:hypothetical protein